MILAAIETQFLILILLEDSLDNIFSIKSPEIMYFPTEIGFKKKYFVTYEKTLDS